MRRPKKEIQLTSYDELLGLEESPEKSMNQLMAGGGVVLIGTQLVPLLSGLFS